MTLDESSKSLHVADWVIIAIYFLGCIIVGLWVSNLSCFHVSGLGDSETKL